MRSFVEELKRSPEAVVVEFEDGAVGHYHFYNRRLAPPPVFKEIEGFLTTGSSEGRERRAGRNASGNTGRAAPGNAILSELVSSLAGKREAAAPAAAPAPAGKREAAAPAAPEAAPEAARTSNDWKLSELVVARSSPRKGRAAALAQAAAPKAAIPAAAPAPAGKREAAAPAAAPAPAVMAQTRAKREAAAPAAAPAPAEGDKVESGDKRKRRHENDQKRQDQEEQPATEEEKEYQLVLEEIASANKALKVEREAEETKEKELAQTAASKLVNHPTVDL